MDRNRGTAIGIIALAGLMLRPVGSLAPQRSTPILSQATHSALGAESETIGNGPWVASCKYWAPARVPQNNQPGKAQYTSGSFTSTSTTVDLHLSAKRAEMGCDGSPENKWGIPALNVHPTASPHVKSGKAHNANQVQSAPHITVLIAVVPDPIRTHQALNFDRTIDSIVEAAAANNYVSSYYWLPWRLENGRQRESNAAGADKPAEESEEPDHVAQRQPGLMIFKPVPQPVLINGKNAFGPGRSFYRAIYIFLVGETPTLGVDGAQLQKAFQYEAELRTQDDLQVDFSMPGSATELDIIGPFTSGSAASLRAGIDGLNETLNRQRIAITNVEAVGITSSNLAEEQMVAPGRVSVHYRTFGDDSRFALDTLDKLLCQSNFDMDRVAILKETGTLFSVGVSAGMMACHGRPIVIDFPREISLLRNAHSVEQESAASTSSPPSPYLPLSLLDLSAFDSVPHYSDSQTPLSQEAQLMAISRLLQRYRTQFVAILASSEMDKLFLAQYLHWACPDTRLIDLGGDLLVERAVDNVPFIGTLTVSSYPLVGASRESLQSEHAMEISDSGSVAYFNAASFVFWDGDGAGPHLLNYRNAFANQEKELQPGLWLTTVGRDGYYPLATIAMSPSKSPWQMPKVEIQPVKGEASKQEAQSVSSDRSPQEGMKWLDLKPNPEEVSGAPNVAKATTKLPVYPARSWMALCTLVSLLCILHLAAILVATYTSPSTCDLSLDDNAEPHRRSMYIHIGSSMLFCMSFVTAFPLFDSRLFLKLHGISIAAALITLALGLAVLIVTFWKTRGYLWRTPKNESEEARDGGYERYLWADLYLSFRVLAWLTILATMGTWWYFCSAEGSGPDGSSLHRGLFFSFRCLRPDSGVSPAVPILLMFASWYVWAVCQTRRLRFSLESRPRMPGRIGIEQEKLFFVSDQDLKECTGRSDSCLYENMTCLLITRQVLRRFGLVSKEKIDPWLALGYALAAVIFVLLQPIKGLEHMLWRGEAVAHVGTPYEWYFTALFFPLMLIALTGWLRMVFIWGGLHRGLLEWLEYQPVRHAFGRLKAIGWMTLLSQGGKHEQWRDMARCTQAMRQILNDPSVTTAIWQTLNRAEAEQQDITYECTLGKMRKAKEELDKDIQNFDIKDAEPKYKIMDAIESRYAAFAEGLLLGLLVPYWRDQHVGFVESEARRSIVAHVIEGEPEISGREPDSELASKANLPEPYYIQVAEEFLALRYFSLIRAVLVNMRFLMIFVTICFVLTITALNVYPFQPRIAIDWFFTGLLVFLGGGVIYVLAVMHRNPILSRITHTKPNELGGDFWVRVLSFGAAPVVTWMAYQFPSIGSMVYKLIQPGTGAVR